MATDCFKFWDSYYEALKMVPTPEQGYRLVMALCAHVFEDSEPDFSDDPLLGMVYTIMDEQAIQSRDISRRARESGSRGGKRKAEKSRGASRGARRGASSEKKRSEEKRSYASSIEEATHMGAPAPVAGAPAPAPEPCPHPVTEPREFGGYPPPPPPPET